MALEDDQRKWLNTALKGKGRIKSAGIKKQFENYKRRREKVEVVFKDLPTSHVNYVMINAGLTLADKQAKSGEFKAAYQSLDKIKALAKVTDAGKAGDILENEIRQSADLIRKLVDAQVDDIDRCFATIDAIMQRFVDIVPCSAKATMKQALDHRKAIVAIEPDLRGAVDAAGDEVAAVDQRIVDRKITAMLATLRAEFDQLTKAGHAAIVQNYQGIATAAETKLNGSGGKYASASPLSKAFKEVKLNSEKTLLARKNLDTFKQGEQEQDARTRNAQAGLKEQDVFAMLDELIREEERMELMREQYLAEIARDRQALAKTGTVDLELTPERPEFDAGGFVDDITVDPHGKLKSSDRAQAASEAGQKMLALLGDNATPQSVLLDLMSKDQNALASDIFNKMYPGEDWNDLSDKQRDLVYDMSKEMFDTINQNAPNKVTMDDEGPKSVSVGGVVYDRVNVLKSGGLGTATLFMDPKTGKKMVVKTPLAGKQEAYDDLLKEMKTMDRVQEGAASGPNASPAPEFYGAARGEDGSMHCMMEYIDGGDLDEVGKTINAVANSGFLPPAARTAMQADMIGKAARALGELQRQGLLHHDIKELNVMMTRNGDVRIIDYGESAFVQADGTAKGDALGNATPGYLDKDGFGDGATVEADAFSLGSMLLSMAGQTKVDKWNRNEPDGGALGRLISALHSDPGQRVSLEGMAQSAFMTAADTDFGPEVMDELRASATRFAQDTRSLKSDMDYEDLKAGLGNMDAFDTWVSPDKKLGLDTAQSFIAVLDIEMDAIHRALQTNPKKLTQEELAAIPQEKREKAIKERETEWLTKNRDMLSELIKAKAFLQTKVINPMLDKAMADADTAYQKAIDDAGTTVDVSVMGEKKTLTLKAAVKVHADLLTLLDNRRKSVVTWLESADGEPDQIAAQLDDLNKDLVAMDTDAKALQAQIEEAAGPEASLRFSKARLEAASVPFGPSQARRTQQEMEDDALKTLEAMVKNWDVNTEVEEKARTAAE